MCSTISYNPPEILITGLGVTSAIGQGKESFSTRLLEGRHAFGVMQRSGRQMNSSFLGAEISSLSFPKTFTERMLRSASFSSQVAMLTLNEAWEEAKLDDVDPYRIGLMIGGSNVQQRELVNTYESYKDRAYFIRPTYGLTFMDTDLCGICTEQFNIRGFANTLGAASASGQAAILQAIHTVQSGQVDVCIVMGALMDISYWECCALRNLGAMGTDRYADEPAMACRPFDRDRDGFIYGESCGVIVIERSETATMRGMKPYAKITGWAIGMDGNRNPDPSYEGEVHVIQKAMERAQLSPREIDYINPHGTGSIKGDDVELKAVKDSGLSHAFINATKSIIGHGLSSAGVVEVIATLLQMEHEMLHPTRNLENPIEASFNWVRHQSLSHRIENALNLSFGFGGINTAICLKRIIKQ